MPIRPSTAKAADDYVTPRLASINTFQVSEVGLSGKYAFKNWTHDTPPADGNTKAVDNPWSGVTLAASMPVSLRTSRYKKTTGEGWYLEMKVVDKGVTYLKRIHGAGPDPDVIDITDWEEVGG